MIITDETIRQHWRALRWLTRCIAMQFRFDADDLFSDVLYRVWKSRNRFHGDDKAFKQWCVCIAYNLCKDKRRYNKPRAHINCIVRMEDDADRHCVTTGDPMLSIEAADILERFKQFVTIHYGTYWRGILWQRAKGFSIKKKEIGNSDNAFRMIARMRTEFKTAYA